MNPGPYEIALIAGGFTIIGVLLGAWIGYRNALKIHNIVDFNKAAASFRASFVKELILLDDRYVTDARPRQTAYNILAKAFSRHCKAFNKFKVYISKNKITCYEKAWNDLYHPYKNKGYKNVFLEEYFHASNALSEQKPISEKVLKKINNLLEFAKYE